MPDLLVAILVLFLRLAYRTIDVVSDLVFPLYWGKVAFGAILLLISLPGHPTSSDAESLTQNVSFIPCQEDRRRRSDQSLSCVYLHPEDQRSQPNHQRYG